jgi:hypothetical protein
LIMGLNYHMYLKAFNLRKIIQSVCKIKKLLFY